MRGAAAHREIDICVHTDEPLIEVPPAPFGDTERRIAANLQASIPERATLQMGIGAIPEAVVASLVDHRDLGVHSGMIGNSVAMLMQRGAVTNAAKGLDPGVTVTGSLIGTSGLYRFADRNRALMLRPAAIPIRARTSPRCGGWCRSTPPSKSI